MADNNENQTENSTPSHVSPGRPRFSLWTLLLIAMIASLGVALWGVGNEVMSLREEMLDLRLDGGFLTIEDPEKIHAIALHELQPRKWTYRVYLPPGHNYFVACQINNLPLGGVFPRMRNPPTILSSIVERGNRMAYGLAPGEYLITLAVFKEKQGDWKYHLDCRISNTVSDGKHIGILTSSSSGGTYISDSMDDQWPSREGAFSSEGVSEQMSVLAPEKPFMLLDGRAFDETVGSSENSTQGAVLWIEPIP